MHQFLQQFSVPHVQDSKYDQQRSNLRGRRSRWESLLHQTVLQSKGQPQKLKHQSGCQIAKFTLEYSFEQNWTFSFAYMYTWGFCMRARTWESMGTLTSTYNCEGHTETDLLHRQQFHSVSKLYLSATPSFSMYPDWNVNDHGVWSSL